MIRHKETRSRYKSSRAAFGLAVFLHIAILVAIATMSVGSASSLLPQTRLLVSTISLRACTAPKIAKKAPKTTVQPSPMDTSQASPNQEQSRVDESQDSATCDHCGEKPTKKVPEGPVKNAAAVRKEAPSRTKSPVKSGLTKGAKKNSPASKKKTLPTQDGDVDLKLLQGVLKNLDRSKNYTGSSGKRRATGGNLRKAASVGSLEIDQGIVSNGAEENSLEGAYGEASPEACYIADLIRRLQLHIRLPEPGEIKVQLTVRRNGTVASLVFVRCQKESLKKALQTKLASITFLPFGNIFPSEAEHTFALRLTHDLVWSCS